MLTSFFFPMPRGPTYLPGMRRQMEDETVICPSLRDMVPQLPEERDFALFGIFDGHGGKQVWGQKSKRVSKGVLRW